MWLARAAGARLPRRLLQLHGGLLLYGISLALVVRAELGLGPWDVLHQGVAVRLGLSIGTVVVLTGVAVLLLWWPLRQRPGVGTVANALLIGPAMDATLALLGTPSGMPARVLLLCLGIALNGAATGAYLAARLGPGPRDGLMTGLHQLTGRSIRLVRTALELSVLAVGLLLGGSAGVGTVAFALGVGPLTQFFLGLFAVGPRHPGGSGLTGGAPARSREGRHGGEGERAA